MYSFMYVTLSLVCKVGPGALATRLLHEYMKKVSRVIMYFKSHNE
jgi:hypothetical protein